MNRVLFSAASEHWSTPTDLYSALDAEFSFTLDPCPIGATDGIEKSWANHRVYCNPPYGPKVRAFLEKHAEAQLSVFLLPARTDTRWFHEVCLKHAREIRFLKGRLKFGDAKTGAPFPSMLVIFGGAA